MPGRRVYLPQEGQKALHMVFSAPNPTDVSALGYKNIRLWNLAWYVEGSASVFLYADREITCRKHQTEKCIDLSESTLSDASHAPAGLQSTNQQHSYDAKVLLGKAMSCRLEWQTCPLLC